MSTIFIIVYYILFILLYIFAFKHYLKFNDTPKTSIVFQKFQFLDEFSHKRRKFSYTFLFFVIGQFTSQSVVIRLLLPTVMLMIHCFLNGLGSKAMFSAATRTMPCFSARASPQRKLNVSYGE